MNDRFCKWKEWVRMPDRVFWAALFEEPPQPSQRDSERRARLSRYGIGLTSVLTLLYLVVPVFATQLAVPELMWVNGLALAAYLFAMWMASLGRHELSRGILMVAANTQTLALIVLTGDSLNLYAFTFAIAALARALYSPREPRRRFFYVGMPVAILVWWAVFAGDPLISFPEPAELQLAFIRVLNLVTCLLCVLLVIALYEREVLVSEADLEQARERSDRLLAAVLPESIAERMRQGELQIADSHP